ncbi:hypothetical protein PL81_14325, partial [Streptomyces sp. RSD-27]
SDPGTVTADKVRAAQGVNTPWVGDRDAGKGWLGFPQSGVDVRKDGGEAWGNVAADKADLNGVNTKWVQGRSSDDGWIEFPPAGINVFQGAGSRQWGTVAADQADLNDLLTHRALVKDRLTLQGGLTVNGEALFEGKVNANAHLSVRGAGGWVMHTDDDKVSLNSDLRVQGESAFHGKVNADAHLSVRGGGAWVVHTNDGQVSVNGDLRVHGAFRSDS